MARTFVAFVIFIVSSLLFVSGIFLMGLATSENNDDVLVSGNTIFGIQSFVDRSRDGVFLYNFGLVLMFFSFVSFLIFVFYVYRIVVQIVKYGYVFD